VGLALVAVHDEYKEWVRDVFPGLWEWAVEGCHIGRSDAVESIPALLPVFVSVAAFWFARESSQSGTASRRITSGLVWIGSTIASLLTLFWLQAMFVGLPGGC